MSDAAKPPEWLHKITDRRQFLRVAAVAGVGMALWPRGGWGFGEASNFGVGRIQYAGGTWDPRPGASQKLLQEIEKRTSILTDQDCPAIDARNEALFDNPFCIWAGDRGFDPLSDEERANLQLYLRAGGTLVIDSSEGVVDGEFDRAVRREMAAILPEVELARVPPEHVVYKSFYLIDEPPGRELVVDYMEACEQDGRLMVIYSQNDLMGAWARDNFGNWLYEVHPGGERQREMAFRMGINLAMYVLCLDYKEDQVHVPFILHRRQWRLE